MPSLRPGLDEVTATIRRFAGTQAPVVAIEATGGLHGPWVRALEERFPSSVRVFAPSETAAARAQLGSRRFKSDDRDCAALTYLARQGQGRPVVEDPVESMRAAVRYRRGLVAERRVAQQRLHDQLNALCPGLSAPAGHGRVLELEDSSGQARAGGQPTPAVHVAAAPGRSSPARSRSPVGHPRPDRCRPERLAGCSPATPGTGPSGGGRVGP